MADGAAAATGLVQGLRLGYLASRYPAISHSFIRREIRGLRLLGARVDTFGIHCADPDHVLTADDRDELATTYAVLPVRWGAFARAHVCAARADPLAYAGTLLFALRLPPAGRRGRLSALFHFAEAVAIWVEARERGLQHMHAHFTSPSADVAMIAGRLSGGRLTWSFTAHGVDIPLDDPLRLAEKVRRASAVVCVSDYGRAQLMGLVDASLWPKLHLVRCGVDVEEFARGLGPSPGEGLRLLTVGRAEPVKGQAILLEALAELKRRSVQASLTIVGGGSLLAELASHAEALGVSDRVHFTGGVGQDRIREHYAAADVFCLSSFAEGVPVVLMEAMAMELPVVASRITGVPELVDEGRSGLLVPPARPDLLADALERLTDPVVRSDMGRAGRAAVAARFDPVVAAERMATIFAAIADGRRQE